jgi:hypothetical protein
MMILIKRRQSMQWGLGVLGGCAFAPLAHAHHGWSSFNDAQPFYLEGVVRNARWQNPHAELELAPRMPSLLPTDLAKRAVPAQTNPVDVAAVMAKARVPELSAPLWTIELAPLTRMEQWKVAQIKAGDTVAVVGYMLAGVPKPLMRVEVLLVGDKLYGLRSSPA